MVNCEVEVIVCQIFLYRCPCHWLYVWFFFFWGDRFMVLIVSLCFWVLFNCTLDVWFKLSVVQGSHSFDCLFASFKFRLSVLFSSTVVGQIDEVHRTWRVSRCFATLWIASNSMWTDFWPMGQISHHWAHLNHRQIVLVLGIKSHSNLSLFELILVSPTHTDLETGWQSFGNHRLIGKSV